VRDVLDVPGSVSTPLSRYCGGRKLMRGPRDGPVRGYLHFFIPDLILWRLAHKAVRDVAHVERRGCDLHRGVRRHGRDVAADAGVIVDRRAAMATRRISCGDPRFRPLATPRRLPASDCWPRSIATVRGAAAGSASAARCDGFPLALSYDKQWSAGKRCVFRVGALLGAGPLA